VGVARSAGPWRCGGGLVGWLFRRMPDPAATSDEEEDADAAPAAGPVAAPSLSPLWGTAPRVFAVVVSRERAWWAW